MAKAGVVKDRAADERISVRGKFLYKGSEKFYLKGVTYGTFAPREDGLQFPESAIVEKDFAQMVDSGFNCVRTYTAPPVYVLPAALAHHLKLPPLIS